MKPLPKIALFFSLCSFIISCGTLSQKSELSEYGNVLEAIIKKKQGTFRGINLGISLDSLKLNETEGLNDASDDYLYYEFKIDSSTSYSVAYSFDEKKLNEIQVDIFLTTEEQASIVYTHFKDFFTKKYGTGENDNGFLSWSTSIESGGNVKIALADESSDYNYGKLTLSFYNAEY